MKKLSIIILALVIALGSLGVSYAYWNLRTLTPVENISTGVFACQFQQVASNDGASLNDPAAAGSWSWSSGTLSSANWSGTRSSINKASATVSGAPGQTLNIVMSGAYDGYCSSIGCTIKNTGNIPMKINSVSAVVTPPAGGSAGDLSVSFTNALVAGSHTSISPGSEVLGAIYIVWNNVPSSSSTYGLTVTINTNQFNN
jgi:hypothetical protein